MGSKLMGDDTPMEDANGMAIEEDQTGNGASERPAGDAEDEELEDVNVPSNRADGAGEDQRGDSASERAERSAENFAASEAEQQINEENEELEDVDDRSNRRDTANGAGLAFHGRTSDDDARDLEEKEKDWDAVSEYEQPEDEPVEDDDLADELGEGVADAQDENGRETEEGEDAEPAGNMGDEAVGDGAKAGPETEEGPRMITFPLARVKRIVKLDPDIKQVSSEALKTIGLAAELFLESLAVSTAYVTRAGKRSTLKIEDLLQTVKTRRRYKECLGGDLEYLRTVDENQAAKQAARQSKKQEAARQLAPGVKPITSFFKQ